jgi:hypothetical protein
VSPEKRENTPDTFLPTDEQNFPKLPTSAQKTPQVPAPQSTKQSTPPQFVWCHKTYKRGIILEEEGAEEEADPRIHQTKAPDSAPITRQGYRTGRLAEDFWVALEIPNTPAAPRKTLRVIPILTRDKNQGDAEYLINKKNHPHNALVQVHIAELLAGLPWTEQRARNHVVNELAQVFHKILVFTNPAANPLQRWKQGRWLALWTEEAEGAHVCTLYMTTKIPDQEKPRVWAGTGFTQTYGSNLLHIQKKGL